jgi:hypothetical protein
MSALDPTDTPGRRDPAVAGDAHADQGRTRRTAVRPPGPEQARVEGHGRSLLRAWCTTPWSTATT